MTVIIFYGCSRIPSDNSGHTESNESAVEATTAKNIDKLREENAQLISQIENIRWNAQQLREFINDKHIGIWGMDNNMNLVLVKRMVAAETNISDVIREINRFYPPPEYPGISLIKVEGATARIWIKNEGMLTQRMGSAGAREYLATVTTSITSFPGIESVWFQFDEGDHAIPGKYARLDFVDLWLEGNHKGQ